jgi:hypothetical protein
MMPGDEALNDSADQASASAPTHDESPHDGDGDDAAAPAAGEAPAGPSSAALTPKVWRTRIEGPPLSRKSSRSHKRKKFDDEILEIPHVEKRKKTPKDKTEKSAGGGAPLHTASAAAPSPATAATGPFNGLAATAATALDSAATATTATGVAPPLGLAAADVHTLPAVSAPATGTSTVAGSTSTSTSAHAGKRAKTDGAKRSRSSSKGGRSNSGSTAPSGGGGGVGVHQRRPSHDDKFKSEPSAAAMTAFAASAGVFGAPRHRDVEHYGSGSAAAASAPPPTRLPYVPPPVVMPNVIRGDREAQRWVPEDDLRLLINMEQVIWGCPSRLPLPPPRTLISPCCHACPSPRPSLWPHRTASMSTRSKPG